jgi:integrase
MMIPTITVTHVPGRPQPWAVLWREPRPSGPAQRRARYFPTAAEAAGFKADLLTALRKAPPPPPAPTARATVAAYLQSWLQVHVKDKRDGSTYRSYEGLVRLHILPAPLQRRSGASSNIRTFGALVMADLTPLRVATLYEDLFARHVSLATRKHVHTCLSSACARAVLDEVLVRNPCAKLGRDLRHKGEQVLDPEPNPFSRAEAQAFLAHVAAHEPDWLPYFQCLHDTGVRVGEIAALRWPCVDLPRRRVEIVASYSPTDQCDKAPKTHQRRWVDLTDCVVDQLTEWRARQRVELLQRGLTNPSEYVYTLKHGSPRRQDGNMRRVFDRVVAALLLNGTLAPTPEAHTPHDLRDTFATTHIGDDYRRLPWVSRQLGHASERTTMEHYYRFLPSAYTSQFANQIR